MNDFIRLAMETAARKFGGRDGTFNAANFAVALARHSVVNQLLDGRMVRALLTGRNDVKVLSGNHYRLSR